MSDDLIRRGDVLLILATAHGRFGGSPDYLIEKLIEDIKDRPSDPVAAAAVRLAEIESALDSAMNGGDTAPVLAMLDTRTAALDAYRAAVEKAKRVKEQKGAKEAP